MYKFWGSPKQTSQMTGMTRGCTDRDLLIRLKNWQGLVIGILAHLKGLKDGKKYVLTKHSTTGSLQVLLPRYNMSGFVEELPQLPENRHHHVCAALPATGVRLAERPLCLFWHWDQVTKSNPPITPSVQALVVAGGQGNGSSLLTSVLSLLPGTTTWTSLASLPRALDGVVASLVGGRIRLVGGRDGEGSYRQEVSGHWGSFRSMWQIVDNQCGKNN